MKIRSKKYSWTGYIADCGSARDTFRYVKPMSRMTDGIARLMPYFIVGQKPLWKSAKKVRVTVEVLDK